MADQPRAANENYSFEGITYFIKMKVDTKHIVAMLDEIKALLGGIEETFREGENVEQTIFLIADNVKSVMMSFSNQHMTHTQPAQSKKEHPFLRRYDVLHKKSNLVHVGLTPDENIEFFKAKFYLFLKRELQKVELPVNLNRQQLIVYIEDNVVMGGPMSYAITSTEMDRYAYHILDIIVLEILEYRRKYPQIELILDNPKKASKALIDII